MLMSVCFTVYATQRTANFVALAILIGTYQLVSDKLYTCRGRRRRRVMCLHPATHCYLLPLLSGTLPISVEICKRSACFVLSCLSSRSSLVRCITRHGIAARYDSVIERNALVCCKWFDLSLTDTNTQLSLTNRAMRLYRPVKVTEHCTVYDM